MDGFLNSTKVLSFCCSSKGCIIHLGALVRVEVFPLLVHMHKLSTFCGQKHNFTLTCKVYKEAALLQALVDIF